MTDLGSTGRLRLFILALLAGIAVDGSAYAVVVNVPVSTADQAAWSRSDGGTGTVGESGSTPGVWNSTFTTSIPAGSTGISFTLDSFSVDDKGVVQLNGTTIGDAVIFQANGGAAGAGTFDFGLGGGNQAYTYVGFTPGTPFSLPDGTTTFTLVGRINDTSSADPSSTPLATVFISSFSLTGTLTFDAPATATPTVSVTATVISTATVTATPSTTPTSTSTPTITNTPTQTRTPTITSTPMIGTTSGSVPAIPALSSVGAAVLGLLLAALAFLLLARSRT